MLIFVSIGRVSSSNYLVISSACKIELFIFIHYPFYRKMNSNDSFHLSLGILMFELKSLKTILSVYQTDLILTCFLIAAHKTDLNEGKYE